MTGKPLVIEEVLYCPKCHSIMSVVYRKDGTTSDGKMYCHCSACGGIHIRNCDGVTGTIINWEECDLPISEFVETPLWL